MEGKKTCANCQHDLDVGVDAIKVDKEVVGMRGFVLLETLLFCSENCLRDYYDLSDLPKVPKRIP